MERTKDRGNLKTGARVHWTKKPGADRVAGRIWETRREHGTDKRTAEANSKAVATRMSRGSYVPWNKGKPLSKAHRDKWLKSMRAKSPEEHRVRLSKMVKTRRARGSYPKPDPSRHTKFFRSVLAKMVRERDGYKCQNCFTLGRSQDFDVHHIDEQKQNDDPMNLILLCKACHCRVTMSSRRAYWMRKFRDQMDQRFLPISRIGSNPYEGMVYNLEVEVDNSYVANGVAVHNCILLDSSPIPGNSLVDHPNGMCVAAPVLKTPAELGLNVPPDVERRAWSALMEQQPPSMRERFFQMAPAKQAEVFGNRSLYELWKAEDFPIDAVIGYKNGMLFTNSAKTMQAKLPELGGISNPIAQYTAALSMTQLSKFNTVVDAVDRAQAGVVLTPQKPSINRSQTPLGLDRMADDVELTNLPLSDQRVLNFERGNLQDLPWWRYNEVARILDLWVRRTKAGTQYYAVPVGTFARAGGKVFVPEPGLV